MDVLIYLSALAAGFALIVFGADRFVTGASATACNYGISPLVIGLTIVGLGTSAPEILIAVQASLNGNTALAMGNAIGSNITNITLIVGVTAVIVPLSVKSEILKREFPILFAVTLLVMVLISDGTLSRIDGILMLTGLVVMLYWVTTMARSGRQGDPIDAEYEAEIPKDLSNAMAIFWLLVGMAILIGSSKLLVWGAVKLATLMGVSELVIGLTIIAIGTSLPELAASVMSAIKKEPDIAIGNVIGSNMFNLLAVMCVPGLLRPGGIEPALLSRDYLIMVVLTLVLFAMAYGFKGPGKVNRLEGALLLVFFVAYQLLLYYYKGTSLSIS